MDNFLGIEPGDKPDSQAGRPESVLDGDQRKQVNDTQEYPWRCICALRIFANDGTLWRGTGWLIGSRTLITAGHCVYLHENGGWAQRIEVIPGSNGRIRPYGYCIATRFRSVNAWVSNQNSFRDYGAIILPDDCAYGRELGYFGYEVPSSYKLLRLKVTISGYPSDKTPKLTQWYEDDYIVEVDQYSVRYSNDTSGGQSGSAVWYMNGHIPSVVAIHNLGTSSGNVATRITSSVYNNFNQWRDEGEI